MAAINTQAHLGKLLAVVLGGLAACTQPSPEQDEMGWAQAALERNGRLEIVAVDRESGLFRVREKGSSELMSIRPNEIVAVLPARGETRAEAADGAQASSIDRPSGTPVGTPEAPAFPASAAAPPSAAEGSSPVLGEAGETAARPQARESTETAGQDVLASGPGYTIKRGTAPDGGSSSGSSLQATPMRPPVTTSAVEHRSDMIICQGARLLHIDNRNLEFDGDAVRAQDGCELHITNSRIAAKGIGVSADAANVHIKNSSIEGAAGSVEASNGAQVYLQSSSMKGMTRRLDAAALHDLGGNVWD